MSRPRFLADHDLNEQIVTGVFRREPGIEFRRAREEGLDASPDPVVLERASVEGLIVVSHDVNTMPAHAMERIGNGKHIAGLLMVAQRHAVGPVVESLLLIWAASEAEEWLDRIAFLPIR
jgi:predicted nuclease of predicted toxin-antitoxin system